MARHRLVDELDWRLRLLSYGLEYLASDQGEMQREQVVDDLGMLVLELRRIVESNDAPTHEGPTGPLPPGVVDALE